MPISTAFLRQALFARGQRGAEHHRVEHRGDRQNRRAAACVRTCLSPETPCTALAMPSEPQFPAAPDRRVILPKHFRSPPRERHRPSPCSGRRATRAFPHVSRATIPSRKASPTAIMWRPAAPRPCRASRRTESRWAEWTKTPAGHTAAAPAKSAAIERVHAQVVPAAGSAADAIPRLRPASTPPPPGTAARPG